MTLRNFASICFMCISGCLLAASQTPAPASSATPAPSSKQQCRVDTREPTEGETALARKDYKAAAEFYTAAIAKDANSDEAHLGMTRALIGQDNTAGALAEANTMLARNPSSALGELALGEADYRAANFDEAYDHYRKGAKDDPCEGRIFAATANIARINAYFARASGMIATAHTLRPNDEVIRRNWIGSLPQQQRVVELAKYLAGPHALSERDSLGYSNEEERLKAHHPGECHIASKTENTRVPFEPIYSENGTLQAKAYGLDVNFDGKRRRMQIDSGASGIVLTRAAAKGLNLTPEFHYKARGVGDDGEIDSYVTHVASIRIGDVEVTDCMVEVLGSSTLNVDGLIGVDVFDHWLVTLDYQRTQLMLSPLPPRPDTSGGGSAAGDATSHSPMDRYIAPEMKDWLNILRIGHELLLPAQIGNGPIRFLMADTGASQSVLSLTAAREAGKVSEDTNVKFSGVSGKVKKVYRIENTRLRFGPFEVPPTNYFAFDITNISHDTGTEVSGFVGLPTLSRLTISLDYRDNLVKMTYDPKHDAQRF